MKTHLLFLLVMALFAACAKGNKTSANLSVVVAGINMNGVNINHIIVTGTNGKQSFSRSIGQTGTLNVALDNGVWNFVALSWEGVNPFTGKVRCAFQQNINLSGTDVNLSLNMTNATCNNSTLSNLNHVINTAGVYSFRTTSFQSCLNDPSTYASADVCAVDTSLPPAPFKAARVALADTGPDAAGGGSFSVCTPLDATTRNVSGKIDATMIPVLNSAFYFPVAIQGFQDTSCTGTFLEAKEAKLRIVDYTAGTQKVFARFNGSDICSTFTPSLLSDIGNGTANLDSPYGLCNLDQLRDFQQSFGSYRNNNIVLLADLDLNTWVKGGATPFASCLAFGSTFIPLGHGSCATSAPSFAYNAHFNGASHTISHFRYRDQADPKIQGMVGFFGQIGASGQVRDIRFSNSEVSARQNVGTVVGYSEGNLTNIKVTNSDIEADDDTSMAGGIAGQQAAPGVLSNIQVSKSKVRGKGILGGIVGQGNNISYATFSGEVATRGACGVSAETIGGIAGRANDITRSLSTGHIAGGTITGGIVGDALGLITFVRSSSAISSHCTSSSLRVGGVVGEQTSGNIENSFFIGSIQHKCSSGVGCIVGEIAGTAAANTALTVSLGTTIANTYGGTAGNDTSNFHYTNITAAQLCNSGICTADQWSFASGDMPRFSHEQHPCSLAINAADVDVQMNTHGRGTAANPIKLCTPAQLSYMGTLPNPHALLDKHYEVQQDIRLINKIFSAPFAGNFNGRGYLLHGYVDSPTTDNQALFVTNNGTLSNIRLANIIMNGTVASNHNAILVSTNNSIVEDIRVLNGYVSGNQNIGSLVANNSATASVRRTSVNAQVEGQSNLGGLIGTNQGTLQQSHFTGEVRIVGAISSNKSNIGGLVAINAKNIKTSEFSGRIYTNGVSWGGNLLSQVGLIAGFNQPLGNIQDVLVSDHAEIELAYVVSDFGGVVGVNNGVVSRAVNFAYPANITNAHFGSNFASIVGVGNSDANSFAPLPWGQEINDVTTNNFNNTLTLSGLNCNSSGATWTATPPNGPYVFTNNGNELLVGTIISGEISVPEPTAGCGSLTLAPYVKTVLSNPLPLPTAIGDLATVNGFSLWQEGVNNTAIINAHLSYLAGGSPTHATWIYEDEELRLFSFEH